MALVVNGKIALKAFLLGIAVLLFPILAIFWYSAGELLYSYPIISSGVYVIAVNAFLRVIFKDEAYQVGVRACNLGVFFGLGLTLATSSSSLRLLGYYMTMLAVFHWSEYMATAVTNPRNLTLGSFLLDHSQQYHIAAVASVTEFIIECYLWPGLKEPGWITLLGLCLVCGGEVLRKLAMVTASTNFNHYVRHVREEGHVLITHGVYAYCRHPSYVGWFYWSIGSQIMLFNPICLVGYTIASWSFFKNRIYHEEISLLNFFGEEYLNYQLRVGTGIPLITGYRLDSL